MDILRQTSVSNKINEINEYMLNLPRVLAKGLIYSFHVSSPFDQDLSLLLNPSLLPASLEAPTSPASPSSLADPSVLAQDHA